MSGPALSQVLLTNDRWRHRIAAHVPSAGFGVEWAAGRGSLTELLFDHWEYVLALEIDAAFCRELRGTVRERSIGIVRADILEYPLPDRSSPYPVFGNLPYHLTGPLLVKLARKAQSIERFQGLVQWEVAERLAAEPGESSFRSISVLMQWAFEVTVRERVPADAFTPEPDVDSGWIDLVPRERTRPFEAFRTFVRGAFQQPRKTLLNNLAALTDDKVYWKDWMEEHDWDPRRRPHSLTIEEFLQLFDARAEQFE